MNNQYLIPANSKKSQLIFGFFTKKDLIICGVGVLLTIMLLLIFKDGKTIELIISIIPLVTVATLVAPVPNYHNVLQLLNNIFDFYFGVRKYYWKGWCVKDGANDEQ